MYIVGGLIKTMAGADIRDGCIRIRDGKIAEIGKRDEVNFHPAPGERVIEAGPGHAGTDRGPLPHGYYGGEKGHGRG